jgi:probable phosphomutase (TIGR03848 family)
MNRLLLIRHALNDWVGHRVAGWTPGISLNEEGRRQAIRLAEWLEPVPLAAIYSSPLERAVETAQPIAGSHGLPVVLRESIGESRYGDLDGKPVKEVLESDRWNQWRLHPSRTRFPGGETTYEVQVRVASELEGILTAHPDGNIAIVSHADPIRVAIAYYIGLPLDLVGRIWVSPASVTVLRFDEWGPRLTHLSDTGSPGFLAREQRPG